MKVLRIVLMLCSVLTIFATTGTINHAASGSRARPSQRPQYRRGEVVVKFRPVLGLTKQSGITNRTGVPSIDAVLLKYEATTIEPRFRHRPIPQPSDLPDLSLMYRITFPPTYEPHRVARDLAKDPNIDYAEPIYIDTIEEVPNDPQYQSQSHLPQIRAHQAWDHRHGDSTIVIAIVDNGTQLNHPDLRDNLWTNELEANGLPGVDDDDNGYIDDIHGYDLAEMDNDPSNPPRSSGYAYYGHGTHTAGLAAAVTNNSIGVAGISWNCEFMPVKTSFDDDPQYVDRGYEGIIYAAESGADIISCSWGSFGSYSQANQDVITYAYALGSIVVAAAGNTRQSDPHFPSSYMNAISVAWLDSQDRKAYNATWGIGVDVSAPGTSLLSTVPTDGGSYDNSSGSSMATPLVAGLCALVQAQNSGWSNDRIVRQVVLTADNIDTQNPSYVGQLGSGRINALRALTETELTEVMPRLTFFSMAPNDSVSGDGDGFFERGETVNLSITLRNFAISPASDVIVTIDTIDPDVVMTDRTSTIAYCPPDTLVTTTDPLSFTVAADAEAHMANLFVTFISAEGASGSDTISVIIGRMPILLVDDDDGVNNIEEYYTMLFDKLGIIYAHWDHLALGAPSGGLLAAFPIVVWACEWAFPTLEEEDRSAIGEYLDTGGSLFMSGQDIGWDFYDSLGYAHGFSDWYETYLHAIYLADDSPIHNVHGVDDDPIGDGLSFGIWQPGRESANQYPDEIEPAPGSDAIFLYEGKMHHKSGIKYEGDHKVVYLGFGFEAIEGQFLVNPNRNWQIRMEVLKRILNWMNFMTHTPLQDREGITQSIPIEIKIANGSTEMNELVLFWKKEDDIVFSPVVMTSLGDGQYTAEIPPPQQPGILSYYFSAVTPYFEWQAPVGAASEEGDVYSFRVGLDEIPPQIEQVQQLSDTYRKNGTATVQATVSDNIGLREVRLFYQTNDGPVNSTEMSPTGQPKKFEGVLSWSADIGDEISYLLEAIDSSANQNVTTSDPYSFHIVNNWLVDDFESGTGRWNLGDGWNTVPMGHNSSTSITDSPGTYYQNNENNALTHLEPLDLSACSTAAITFYQWYDTQRDRDFGHVEVSADSQSWQSLARYSGYQFPMDEDTVFLTDFCGQGNDRVWIRFRMTSDETDTNDGWYLDDITLWIDLFQTGVEDDDRIPTPQQFTLQQNYPNPFNPQTSIQYAVSSDQTTRHSAPVTLKIYNIMGQEVVTLVDEEKKAGYHTAVWNGRDAVGNEVASGIYFYRLSIDTGRYSETKRMVLMR